MISILILLAIVLVATGSVIGAPSSDATLQLRQQQACSWLIEQGDLSKYHFQKYCTAKRIDSFLDPGHPLYECQERARYGQAPASWFPDKDAGTFRIQIACDGGWMDQTVCWGDAHYGQKKQGVAACIHADGWGTQCRAVDADESCDWEAHRKPPDSADIYVQV